MINNKFCISFMFNNCYKNYEIKKKEKTIAGLWSLHSRTNFCLVLRNLCTPPLPLGGLRPIKTIYLRLTLDPYVLT